MEKFANLHVHSVFSLLDGMTDVEQLVNKTIDMNQPASCITDHGNMFSIVNHFKYAQEIGQKAIAGFEAYVAKDHLIKEKNDKREHFLLLAKNKRGYEQLSKLCSIGNTKGMYYRPRIDDKLMNEIGMENIIGSSACIAGRIPQCLINDDIEGAIKWTQYYYKLFKGDFYLEIQPTMEESQVKVNKGIIEISKQLGVPMIATSDAHYLNKEDSETHSILLAIQSRDKLSNPNRWTFPGDTFYVMSYDEIVEAFKHNGHEALDQNAILEAIHNTVDVANKCNVSFEFGKHYLPVIEPPQDDEVYNKKVEKKKKQDKNFKSNDASYLRHLCIEGLKRKVPEIITNPEKRKIYLDRLNYELDVIEKMNFPSYFLIVADYINYADKVEKMGVGCGRGCFVKDSLVNVLNKGLIEIQNVKINDIVKGHDEKLHNVLNTLEYDCDEEICNIQTENNKKLKLTKDHKVYAIKKEDFENGIREPKWYKIDELNENDYIAELED